jgi:hypothetical protein
MAVIAKVELNGSLTHTHAGRSFKRGQPQVITEASEIAYYKTIPGFAVTVLDKAKEKSPLASVVEPEDAVEPEGEPKAEEPEAKEEETVKAQKPRAPKRRFTHAELKVMNKAQLIEIAHAYGLPVDEDTKKADLMAEIVEAQG